ncbi:CoA activase [Syntrophobacter fumaroxidans]|uniref:CoA enzyme activase n=1 Tax=Syntrophobacter fumaroxidans (strain DSM 10017 / MPOB) TaxID=335543 RepID=A0LJB3_SYNFM|nr:CoA activase [Syntrophobacter fumaroxidans]ABK17515.1 CoA enzyme activase [Syntrophobacter fumaroxidans MPOB]
MAVSNDRSSFDRFHTSVRQFDVSGKTLLLPDMAPFGARLLAACFRAVGVNAKVMETYTGLALGKEFTSGKECFPCQVTLGDILYHLQKEKERLGSSFSPDRYVYFMPEADGPCRFGMYNKLQRLILDRFPEFKEIPIVYLSTEDSYATGGIMPPEESSIFRKLSYVAIIVADVMDRVVWRIRPYESRPGATDAFMAQAVDAMAATIEEVGAALNFPRLLDQLEEVVVAARNIADPRIPRKPRIGIVGEIYLRCHPDSNQNIIRELEKCGAEVLDASLGEWVNFVTFEQERKLRRAWKIAWLDRNHSRLRKVTRALFGNLIEGLYQQVRQHQVYRRALKHLDIPVDHSIRKIERRLQRDRLFTFDIGTEAALSIGGALEYAHEGFDGVVNVFPFTCMPSTICASILKPLLHDMKVPYLDAPYDGAIQPNRETALRTFVYQAKQHLESRTARTKR